MKRVLAGFLVVGGVAASASGMLILFGVGVTLLVGGVLAAGFGLVLDYGNGEG